MNFESPLDGLLGRLFTNQGDSVTADDLANLETGLASDAPDLGLLCLAKLVEIASTGGEATVKHLYSVDIVPFLLRLSSSSNLRVGEALANLSAVLSGPEDRAAFIEQGGFKALTNVIHTFLSTGSSSRVPPDTKILLVACEVYAKIVQTAALPTIFPQPYRENAVAGLQPIFLLLAHPASTPTQVGIALLTLSRLGLTDPVVGSAITQGSIAIPAATAASSSRTLKVVDRIEGHLLNPNMEVSRLATRVVSVLVNSKAGWYYWSGERKSFEFPGEADAKDIYTPKGEPGTLDPEAGRRLGVLLLLTDSDDSITRKSAATALAVLTQSESACSALIALKIVTKGAMIPTKLWDRVADLFEPGGVRPPADTPGARSTGTGPPDRELADRGAMIAFNLLSFVNRFYEPEKSNEIKSAVDSGLKAALEAGIKGEFGAAVDANLKAALKVLNK
ncbi:uncharacterized protein EHS24_000333 [Apiotrichum porosum]|uniref:UNC-45/Cro1/She4 central domain-containing protein n=1 Tax=Apiotrichum porosum TaxID=105984 RepID=A0A427Y9R0_9TREE|nr:uncharacterized protein EHS24_000333 [Apiotrichum porosum]RSH87816.1 hypothetical protein EHS24_000333 [Apiotrichum porosum]